MASIACTAWVFAFIVGATSTSAAFHRSKQSIQQSLHATDNTIRKSPEEWVKSPQMDLEQKNERRVDTNSGNSDFTRWIEGLLKNGTETADHSFHDFSTTTDLQVSTCFVNISTDYILFVIYFPIRSCPNASVV